MTKLKKIENCDDITELHRFPVLDTLFFSDTYENNGNAIKKGDEPIRKGGLPNTIQYLSFTKDDLPDDIKALTIYKLAPNVVITY